MLLSLLLCLFLVCGAAFGMARYSPTTGSNLLKHEVRASIMNYLGTNRSASISELCRNVNIPWGVAQHHLYVLKRAGLVHSAQYGRTHVFFRKEESRDGADLLALMRSARAKQIVEQVVTQPGLRQKDLCDKLNLTRKVFRHHINLLVSAGLIMESKGGAVRMYQPTDLSRERISSVANTPTPAPVPEIPGSTTGPSAMPTPPSGPHL